MKNKKSLRGHRERNSDRWIDCYEFCQWSLGAKVPRGFRGMAFEEYVRSITGAGRANGFQFV